MSREKLLFITYGEQNNVFIILNTRGGGGPLHLEIKGKFLVGENKKNTVSTLFTDI